MLNWKPASGQMALIEPIGPTEECLTGTVVEAEGDAIVINLGGSPRPAQPKCAVTASFFSPEALYRIDGTVSPHVGERSVIDLTIHDIERVQRRESVRARVTVPVVLSNFDDAGGDAFASVPGESIDVGEGGCRVIVTRRFPPGCDPTVSLRVSPSETVVALAAVLEEQPQPDGRFEYRLVFIEQDDGHRELLSKAIANAA